MRAGEVIGAKVGLIVEDCPACGVLFALTQDLARRRQNDHQSCYCPNGHSWHYTGPTDVDKLRQELAEAKNEREYWVSRADQYQAAAKSEKRAHALTKGELIRVRARVQNGVCPDCRRTFVNLARHRASKHAV